MEAAPRLPMISFELKTCTEITSFSTKLKQYIASFYHEDPESYNNEIHNLQKLRGSAVVPSKDVSGVQTLKKYYCQLKFLRSRFPMGKGAVCAPQVSWKDPYAGVVCSAPDIDLELMSILYNVGALHSQLGSLDSRQTPEGMKMACTHYQCAAWAFKEAREEYPLAVAASLAHEVLYFMEVVCLAQAQECILEKSMSDSRKCTIIAKVAAQAVSYYDQAGQVLSCQPEGAASEVTDIIGSRVVKDWCRYIKFKSAYHNCISLLYQGQHCEEQQKMGERCALYQAAADKLEEARKLANGKLSALTNSSSLQSEIEEALGFTLDVVEGKRKAARNENEFIYHEQVPEKDSIPPLQGASLVRPIPFGITDPDVSGPDIFARLVPMEAHEASSIYSEKKAELLRRTSAAVEDRDRELEEFMSSLHQLDILLVRLGQPQVIPQEIVDRAAALNARPQAVQALVDAMAKLSSVHLDVDSLLNEAQLLIENEKEASSAADRRAVVSMPINDLSRECAKYREALSKASESNEALHRAMSAHVANLKVLAQPLAAVDKHLPKVLLSDEDKPTLDELRKLIDKVEEMSQQRMVLITQLREATLSDDITSRLAVNRDRSSAEMENLFDTELAKHRPQVALIEQNLAAQPNILHALTDAYAKLSGCRRIIVEGFRKRDTIISALIASYDAYEDLLAKVNKGIDFYQKLETNVNKLLQRLRSTCRVQEEEREQKNASKTNPQTPQTPVQTPIVSSTPKLRDYLQQPVGVRPAPLGSEHTDLTKNIDLRNPMYAQQFGNLPNGAQNYPMPNQYQVPRVSTPQNYNVSYALPNVSTYQAPTSAYPTSTIQSVPPLPPKTRVTNPQSYQNPQVTPAMPQYQVAPSQYPAVTAPFQNYNVPGTQYLTSHANKVSQSYPPVPQSPTLPQGYPNSLLNYPNYPPEQTNPIYQNQTHTAIKSDASTSQKSVTPTYTAPGQYSTAQSNLPCGHSSTAGVYQVPNSPGSTQNPGSTPHPNISNATPAYQGVSSQYPSGQYTGVPNYPLSGTPNQGSGYPTQIPNSSYQNPVQTQQGGVPNQNQYSGATQSQVSQIGAITGQYPTTMGQTPNLGVPQDPIGSSTQYQTPMGANYTTSTLSGGQKVANWYQNSQGTSGYPPVPNPAPLGTPGVGQYPAGVPVVPNSTLGQQYQVPTSSISPQHLINSQPNVAKPTSVGSPQHYPQPSVSTNQNGVRAASPYYQPGYQSGSQMGQYPQGPKNVYPQQNVAYPVQNQQNLGYHYPSNPQGVNYYHQVPQSGQVPQSAVGTNNQAQVAQNYPNPTLNTAKKNSNIDLLAGLDFNVNQAPLDPVKAPLELKNKDENKVPSEEEISSTDKQQLEDYPSGTKPSQDPDRWKKEQTFEKDVNNLDHWVSQLMEQELESKWKVLQKENENSHVVISVARCYPGRNRCPDSLPYDRNRFELPCPPASDDYINASKVELKNLPPIIITQTPLSTTIQQFWTMVANSGAEMVICLMTDADLQSCGLNDGYWRADYGAHLRSIQVGPFWTERILAVAGKDISHLQLTTSWPSIGSGDIINGLADLAFEVNRRKITYPIIIHCLTGIGRSGTFSVLLEVASELVPFNGPPILIDPLEVALKLSEYRKNPIRDRLHLEFTYRAVLKMARTILPAPVTEQIFPEKVPEVQNLEIKDPLSDLDPLWKLKINDN